MSHIQTLNLKFFQSKAKMSALLLVTLLFAYNHAFSKTINITCPSVKADLTAEYKVSSSDSHQWSSWQSQPRISVSTTNDKNYFAEINQSYKGIELRCVGGNGNQHYGFYTHIPDITSCKIDPKSKTAFICEVR